MSGHKAIHLLADIVAKGGNLLLNIAPGPDGTWDDGAYRLLDQIAVWMKINSEAIYGTRSIPPYKEGKVCLTKKEDGTLYMIYLGDEGETGPPPMILLSTLCPARTAKARMLGSEEKLEWAEVGKGFAVYIPRSLQQHPPCQDAWVIEIKPAVY
jgi:alpha-L-fucosidase